MCVGARLLIPPSQLAFRISAYVKGSLALLVPLGLIRLFGGNFIWGAFDFIFALFGGIVLRSTEGWSNQSIMTLFVLSCILFFYFLYECVVLLTGNYVFDMALWRFYMLIGGLIGAPVIYFVLAVFSYKLWQEMRRVQNEFLNELAGEMGGEDSINQPINFDRSGDLPQPFGFGGFFGRYDQPINQPNDQDEPPPLVPINDASTNQSSSQSSNQSTNQSFTPYTGQGHKLGDTAV